MASPALYGTPVTSTASPDSTNISYTNTVTSEENTAMFVCCSSSNATPSSVTWNGISMTQIYNGTAARNTAMKLFYLAAPTTGTHNVVVTYGEDRAREIAIWTFKNVAQSSPTDISLVSTDGGSNTAASNSVTTATDNDAVITFIGTDGTNATFTPDSPQILIASARNDGAHGFSVSYIVKATAGAITTGYTWSSSSSWDLQIGAVKYHAPSSTVLVADVSLIGYLI